MKRIENPKSLQKESSRVLNDIQKLINKMKFKKASNLVYWLDTWLNNYYPSEDSFDYNSLIHYERGMVVKADLGFKVGSEEGGLHYALVVENNNSKENKTIMVIPLSSLETTESISKVDEKHEVFLGYGIFEEEISKIKKKLENETLLLQQEGKTEGEIELFTEKTRNKLENYRKGSIALVNQMCALSKIRIHLPKDINDELANFRLSNDKLNEVDKKIKYLYTKRNPLKVKMEKFVGIFTK